MSAAAVTSPVSPTETIVPDGQAATDLEKAQEIAPVKPAMVPMPDGGLMAWLAVTGAWFAGKSNSLQGRIMCKTDDVTSVRDIRLRQHVWCIPVVLPTRTLPDPQRVVDQLDRVHPVIPAVLIRSHRRSTIRQGVLPAHGLWRKRIIRCMVSPDSMVTLSRSRDTHNNSLFMTSLAHEFWQTVLAQALGMFP